MCSNGCGSHIHSSSEVSGARWLCPSIKRDGVRCFNEAEGDSGREVLKSYSQRTDRSPECFSDPDGDPELLFYIPFNEAVKIRFVQVNGGDKISHLKLWLNRDDVDFSNVDQVKPACVVPGIVNQDWTGTIDYPLSAKFSNVTSIVCLVQGEEDVVGLSCLGFKGEWIGHKDGIVNVKYELRANIKDHSKMESDVPYRMPGT